MKARVVVQHGWTGQCQAQYGQDAAENGTDDLGITVTETERYPDYGIVFSAHKVFVKSAHTAGFYLLDSYVTLEGANTNNNEWCDWGSYDIYTRPAWEADVLGANIWSDDTYPDEFTGD